MKLKKRVVKLIPLAFTLLTLISMTTGCSNQDEQYGVDYTKEIAEMTFQADVDNYKDALSCYLNKGVYEGDIDGARHELISDTLISKIEIPENTDVITEPPPTSVIDDYEDTRDPDYDYPIIDMFGNIIEYGSKELSDKSFEEYAKQPYYTIMSCEVYYNTALFKVFNKGESKIVVYEAELNESKQLESLNELSIEG